MDFLRLRDALISPLYEDDDIVAIDKAYGLNCHTNEAKAGNEDHIEHGLIEIFEIQLGRKLHIIHRIDQTTTGVVIFGKSTESAKKYAEFFFARQVKKTYWFITANQSKQKKFAIDQPILHKARELGASTMFSFLNKSPTYELWQANPHTGRNHQIRIHAQAVGLSLLGDERYGGKRFPFICLHNCKMTFPNGVEIESVPPAYFSDLNLLEDTDFAQILHEEDRRLRLFSGQNLGDQCFRIAHKLTDVGGYSLDHLGRNLVLTVHQQLNARETKAIQRFSNFRKQTLITIESMKDSTPSAVDEEWTAEDSGLEVELHSRSAPVPGLLNDQRLLRTWVKANSRDREVLNLFASSCGFGLAAAAGGARQVISVDSGKSALSRGRRNFALNRLSADAHLFLCRDSLHYLESCQKKDQKFDLLICHAPAFFRGEKKLFRIEEDLESLLTACLGRLRGPGSLLFLTNAQNLFVRDIRRALEKAIAREKLARAKTSFIFPSLDFELVGEKARLKARLKAFLVQLAL